MNSQRPPRRIKEQLHEVIGQLLPWESPRVGELHFAVFPQRTKFRNLSEIGRNGLQRVNPDDGAS